MEKFEYKRFADIIRMYGKGIIGRNEFIDLWRKEQERQMYLSDFLKGRTARKWLRLQML